MRTEDLFFHTIKSVNKHFGCPPLKGEIRYDNGVFILNFNIKKYVLNFVSDRGFLEVYNLLEEKSTGLMVQYPQIANKWTTPENIDFIVDFLYQHREEIFSDDLEQ